MPAALSGSRKTEFIEFPTLKIHIAKKSCRSPRKFAPAKKLLEFPPRKISRGDIILFERPGSEYPPVKRVIAVAGDTVMFNGVWVVNGEPLQEDYILEESYESDYISPYTCDSAEIFDSLSTGLTLQEGQLFVLGDNRNNSYDSHKYGAISAEWVIGKVVNVY